MTHAARRALVDELERAFLEFGEFVRELPRDLYDEAVPGEEGSVRAILRSLVRFGGKRRRLLTMAIRFTLNGEAREADFPPGESLLDVVRFTREALADVTDEALENGRFVTRWNQEYDGEQMMEHATCHPGRHIRQLHRWLDGELGT
jgi:hypothetical protein